MNAKGDLYVRFTAHYTSAMSRTPLVAYTKGQRFFLTMLCLIFSKENAGWDTHVCQCECQNHKNGRFSLCEIMVIEMFPMNFSKP